MAVIQDLPPELLEHILDFLGEPFDCDSNTNRTPHLAGLALVARNWVDPGQRILYRDFRLSGDPIEHEPSKAFYAMFEGFAVRYKETGRPTRIGFMELRCVETEDIEEAFEHAHVLVDELDLLNASISVATIASAGASLRAPSSCRR